jgi:hypothetical protein
VKIIAQILELAAPLEPGFHIKIENEPYTALVIEDIQVPGPHGHPSISVCHYGELNGDLMRDPEMLFEITKHGLATVLTPYHWRNDYAGYADESAWTEEGRIFEDPVLKAGQIEFARMWDDNLTAQGFLEAFQRQHKPPQAN